MPRRDLLTLEAEPQPPTATQRRRLVIAETALLQQNELFHALSEEQLTLLAPLCSEFVVIQDGILFTEGRQATHLYLVTEGQIALQTSVRVPHGAWPRRTTITVCRPGEAVGWSALVFPHRYTFSAVAWEFSRLIRIEARMLRQALTRYPEMGYPVMQALSEVMARRLRQTAAALTAERESLFRPNGPATL